MKHRKGQALWVTVLAAVLCAALAGCLLTDRASIGRGSQPAAGDEIDARAFKHLAGGWMGMTACDAGGMAYFVDSQYVYYIDKATGITGPLCGKPECTHDDSTCNAFFSDVSGLFYENGRLYLIDRSGPIRVMSTAPDGTDRQVVKELERGFIPSSNSQMVWCCYNGRIFYSTQKKEIKDGKEVYGNYVCAFSVDPDGEDIVILDEEVNETCYSVIQPYEDGLYILTSGDAREDLKIEGPENRRHDFMIRRWDMETGEMTTLYQRGGVPYRSVWELWVTDDGIYYGGQSPEDSVMEIYKYGFDTGEAELLFRFEDAPVCKGNTQISDHMIVGCDIENDQRMYVLVKDFAGETLLEKTYTLPINADPRLFGTDETHAYFFNDGHVRAVIAVPFDGGEAQVLWKRAEEA